MQGIWGVGFSSGKRREFAYLFIYLFAYLFIYLFIYLFTYLIIHLSICWFTFCCVE